MVEIDQGTTVEMHAGGSFVVLINTLETGDYQFLKEKVNMLFLSNDLIEHNHLKKEGKTRTMVLEEIVH